MATGGDDFVLVLGISVDLPLVDRWRGWLMPDMQPFFVPRAVAVQHSWPDERDRLDFESLDAFELYGTGGDQAIVWLDRPTSQRLPRDLVAAQPTLHRWPSGDKTRDRHRAVRYVESGRRPSRHSEVDDNTWAACARQLPGARTLAGTFPDRSGPNCFGTVMAAAGVAGTANEWMQLEPFDAWLTTATEPGGSDDQPGTVLVWRTTDGSPAHAAVTLGDGWLLHKPSQGWMSPTKVLSVRDGKYSARQPGIHLHRYRLRSA